MKPNLPDKQVSAVLVDCLISDSSVNLLECKGIKVYKTIPLINICNSTSTHPDMQFSKLDDNNVLIAKEAYEHYKQILPDFNYKVVEGIASPYPTDSKLNFTIISNKCFACKHHLPYIPSSNILINIKQGYSKCNICILNENAIITSDKGICCAAENHGIKAYFLPDNEISLNGYTNGFWGGCTGLIDTDKLFFNGNIEKLSCYNELLDILFKEKIEPIYNKDISLQDIGSIIPLY